MACMTLTLFSRVLSLSCTVDLVFCEGGDRGAEPFPVLYLLHGGDGDNTSWRRNVAIERLARDSGLAVAMPAVQHGFYADQKYGYDYFSFIADELPLLLGRYLNVSAAREDSFAAGLSMGGYGAFKLGILRPERYAAVASLSGSLDQRRRLTPDSDLKNPVMQRLAYASFGSYEDYVGSGNDLFAYLDRRLAEGARLPAFFMACGTADGNLAVNDEFFERFGGRAPIEYERTEGAGHDWRYWEACFPAALARIAALRGADGRTDR